MIDAFPLQQLPVRSGIAQFAAVENDDIVRPHHHRQPVRNDDHRPLPADHPQVRPDQLFALRVQRAGRLVENQNARIGQQSAGDRQPLPLAAGQVGAIFFQHRIIASAQFLDEFLGTGQ